MARKRKAQIEAEAILAERLYRALVIVGWQPADADDAMLVLGELQRLVDLVTTTPKPGDEEVVAGAFRDIGWKPDADEEAYSPTTIRNALGLPEPKIEIETPTVLQRLRVWFGFAS
jgi:hypothetical protein